MELPTVQQKEDTDVDTDHNDAWDEQETQERPQIKRESGQDDDVDGITHREQKRGGVSDEGAGEQIRQDWQPQTRGETVDNRRQYEGGGIIGKEQGDEASEQERVQEGVPVAVGQKPTLRIENFYR